MRTRPLLHEVTLQSSDNVSLSHAYYSRLIHINPTCWTIYCSLEIILEWELYIGLESKANVLCKSIASKYCNIQFDMNYIQKIHYRQQLGL